MNEKYTYGYNNSFSAENNTLKAENVAWNIENEYINSLNEVMQDYNEQSKKTEELENLIKKAVEEVDASIKEASEETNSFIENAQNQININNNFVFPTFSDEQIRIWYNQDYPSYNTAITFEQYKSNILKQLQFSNNLKKDDLEKRNQELSKQILEKQEYLANFIVEKQMYIPGKRDELLAHQYYLIDVKNEIRKSVLKKKNEINLLLSEKRIQLSSILLEQQTTAPKYDENGKILNSEELIALRNKYDSAWLEIRKLEHALQKIDQMLVLMEYTQAEIDLMMRGLNSNQKEIYNNIINTQMKIDNQVEIQTLEETKNGATELVDAETVEPTEISQGNETQLESEKIPQELFEELVNNIEEQTTKNVVHEEVKDLNFEEIINKVCGDSSFTKAQSSRYTASKIKVFNKPQLNNLGLMGKITSIGKSIIGIIPKTAMKLYGKSIDTETEEMLQGVEKRAMELSDDEVVTLLNEYNNKLDVIPEGFEQMVKPRVNSYVSKRVDYLQKEFNQSMYQIAVSQKAIEEYKDDSEYLVCAATIKGLINIQIEVSNLLRVSHLHSFESQLKSLDNKLVYAGARFERAKDYDTSLWSKISGLSQKIEYSLDPKEVVDSYTERENIYKEYGKHKSYLTEADLEKLNNNSKKEEKIEKVDPTFKTSEEIRSLIEGLKSMKAELTEQDVKEIEGLLR